MCAPSSASNSSCPIEPDTMLSSTGGRMFYEVLHRKAIEFQILNDRTAFENNGSDRGTCIPINRAILEDRITSNVSHADVY